MFLKFEKKFACDIFKPQGTSSEMPQKFLAKTQDDIGGRNEDSEK